ncbi:hypothetical protein IFO70_10255 [Phormidium tenue FACHB-886]|nr:hypothetical protein [Phormidium tenue FACHB-886]
MMIRLGLLGFSGALLAGHLIRFVPAFQHGVSISLAILLLIVVLGAAVGVATMYIKRPYMRRLDWYMGAFPAVVAGLAIVGLVVVGAML